MITVTRILIRPAPLLCCAALLAFLTACATTAKPGQPPAKPAARVSTPVSPEAKAAPVAPPPAAIPAAAAAPVQNHEPAPPASATAQTAAPLPAMVVPVRHATIIGSQETSILLDNFTAFISSVDGQKIAAGREGWNVPLQIDVGHRKVGVEFNRGVFMAKGQLEFEAMANVRYELKYATDTELFGKNSYCNFWVVEIASGQTVSLVCKASVEKVAEAPARQSLLP